MTHPQNFKIDLVSLLDLKLPKVTASVNKNYTRSLQDLKFLELLTNHATVSKDKNLRHGVYVFFEPDGKPLHVGECSSPHFAQRIGEHFGMSPKYKRNTFLQNMVEKLRSKE